ncbi:MAG: YqgE/AlgH family protein [Nitrospirae bacterium]|nr:YqgE/AlgH family protein [Nitrospirota bacterium]
MPMSMAPDTLPLNKGIFLVASPALRDPNFRQAVVLLCEYGTEGALGVIVNRPTAVSLTEAVPQIPVLEGQGHVLFSGGPVQTNQVMVLYRVTEDPGETHHVFDGVYLGGNLGRLERLIVTPNTNESFRAFMGYSGWAPGQLENEMKTGSWLTLPGDSSLVFEKDPVQVWPDIFRSLGGQFAMYADMPADPSLN